MERFQIPLPVVAVVSRELAELYTHAKLDVLFMEAGAPGDSPEGAKPLKCTTWMKAINRDPSVDAQAALGHLLHEMMEVDSYSPEIINESRERIRTVLGKHGLSYGEGGHIVGVSVSAPTRTLEGVLRGRKLDSLNIEFERALKHVEVDPPAAVAAACAILEAFCKVYIEDEQLESLRTKP